MTREQCIIEMLRIYYPRQVALAEQLADIAGREKKESRDE